MLIVHARTLHTRKVQCSATMITTHYLISLRYESGAQKRCQRHCYGVCYLHEHWQRLVWDVPFWYIVSLRSWWSSKSSVLRKKIMVGDQNSFTKHSFENVQLKIIYKIVKLRQECQLKEPYFLIIATYFIETEQFSL